MLVRDRGENSVSQLSYQGMFMPFYLLFLLLWLFCQFVNNIYVKMPMVKPIRPTFFCVAAHMTLGKVRKIVS